jgi:hypothetical protein
MLTNREFIDRLHALAAEHPESYLPGPQTPHKREADVAYSYDDCIVGCLVRSVSEEVSAELLSYEREHHKSFSLVEASHVQTEAARQAKAHIKGLFTREQYQVLEVIQSNQDAGFPWSLLAYKAEKLLEEVHEYA